MVVALSAVDNNTLKGFQSLTIAVTGAGINLILILVLNFIYNKIAAWLTDKELHRWKKIRRKKIVCKLYKQTFTELRQIMTTL